MAADLRASYEELRRGAAYDITARGHTLLRMPTEGERDQLAAHAIALQNALRSISYTKHGPALGLAGAAIAEMFQGFIGFKPDPKVKEQSIGWYVHELSGFPLFAVEAACADVRAGRVPDLKPDFPPTSARMVQLARGHHERVLAEHAGIKIILGAQMLASEVVIDDETAARIKEGLEQLAEGIRTKDARERKEEQDKRDAATLERTRELQLREYRAAGVEPVYGRDGQLRSLALLKNIQEYRSRPQPMPLDDKKDQGS